MVKLAMLNAMASADFAQSLDVQQSLGIDTLDLKDHIFGKSVADLSLAEAAAAAALIKPRGMSVYCLSTQLFHDDPGKGEAALVHSNLSGLDHLIEVARALRTTYIRILPAVWKPETQQDSPGGCVDQAHRRYPWLWRLYQEAIDRICDAGFRVVIENELDSLLASPADILAFFDRVDRPGKLRFTYDPQNLWQTGTYPSVEVYRMLKPVIAYFHVKGGREDPVTKQLKWKSSLADATWPIAEMTREVIKDGVSPVICLNPSHGDLREGYDYGRMVERDLDYMREIIQQA